jgi:hypothetical protein
MWITRSRRRRNAHVECLLKREPKSILTPKMELRSDDIGERKGRPPTLLARRHRKSPSQCRALSRFRCYSISETSLVDAINKAVSDKRYLYRDSDICMPPQQGRQRNIGLRLQRHEILNSDLDRLSGSVVTFIRKYSETSNLHGLGSNQMYVVLHFLLRVRPGTRPQAQSFARADDSV